MRSALDYFVEGAFRILTNRQAPAHPPVSKEVAEWFHALLLAGVGAEPPTAILDAVPSDEPPPPSTVPLMQLMDEAKAFDGDGFFWPFTFRGPVQLMLPLDPPMCHLTAADFVRGFEVFFKLLPKKEE